MVSLTGITDSGHNSYVFLHLDNGEVILYQNAYSTTDGQDGSYDHLLDINNVYDNLGSSANLFTSSSGQGFTMKAGPNTDWILEFDDGTTFAVDSTALFYLRNYDVVGGTRGNTYTYEIDVDAIKAWPNTTDKVVQIEDSSGLGFSVDRGGDQEYLITRSNGEVLIVDDLATNATYDNADTLGGHTNTVDAHVDIAGLDANVDGNTIIRLVDTEVDANGDPIGFTAEYLTNSRMLITRDNGEVFVINTDKMTTYDNATVAGTGTTGEIDVSKFADIVDSNEVYGFFDSTGLGFEISQAGGDAISIARADGTVLQVFPVHPTNYADSNNIFDYLNATGALTGANDGMIDVEGLSNYLNNGYLVHEYYDSTGEGFTVNSGLLFTTITRADGTILTVSASKDYLDTLDRYTVAGLTGGDNDGRIDVAAMAEHHYAIPHLSYAWTGTPTVAAPCFTAGTLIQTAKGLSKVEDLVAGDLVMTKDHGAMPLLWAGATKVQLGANAENRPIVFEAGSILGNTEQLTFSPNHAVVVRSVMSEILFGKSEVLVLAKSLVNDKDVKIDFETKEVHYCHIMFESHEIVMCADGTETESLFVGAESIKGFGAETKAELLSFFPDLAVIQGTAMAPSAMTLTPQQARVLSTFC